MIIGTDIDPETGTTHCVYLRYGRDDFISLAPGESRRFDVSVTLPEGCNANVVTVDVTFDSEFDGRDFGLKAWTGTVDIGSFRIPVTAK